MNILLPKEPILYTIDGHVRHIAPFLYVELPKDSKLETIYLPIKPPIQLAYVVIDVLPPINTSYHRAIYKRVRESDWGNVVRFEYYSTE